MNVLGIPIVRILLEDDLIFILPFRQNKWSVGGQTLNGSPIGITELLNEVGSARSAEVRGEETEEIGRRAAQGEDDGLVIRSLHAQVLRRCFSPTQLGAIQNIVIDRAGGRGLEHPHESMHEVR